MPDLVDDRVSHDSVPYMRVVSRSVPTHLQMAFCPKALARRLRPQLESASRGAAGAIGVKYGVDQLLSGPRIAQEHNRSPRVEHLDRTSTWVGRCGKCCRMTGPARNYLFIKVLLNTINMEQNGYRRLRRLW